MGRQEGRKGCEERKDGWMGGRNERTGGRKKGVEGRSGTDGVNGRKGGGRRMG